VSPLLQNINNVPPGRRAWFCCHSKIQNSRHEAIFDKWSQLLVHEAHIKEYHALPWPVRQCCECRVWSFPWDRHSSDVGDISDGKRKIVSGRLEISRMIEQEVVCLHD
jgi:hypothetical protein